MKHLTHAACAALGLLALAATSAAAQTATQTLTFEVTAIEEMSVSNLTPSLTVSTATAGLEPDPVSTRGDTYAITLNNIPTSAKITGAINSNMPTGVTLDANLAAPAAGGSSAGSQTLSTVAADLVTGLVKTAESSLSLTLTLSAIATAGVLASDTRTITYTIVVS